IPVPEPAELRIASLQEVRRPPGTLRPDVALHVAVISRIAVEGYAAGAGFLGGVDLDGPMAPTVARQHDRATDVNAGGRQSSIIVRQPVVDVDHWTGRRAGARVRDERRAEFRMPCVGIVWARCL